MKPTQIGKNEELDNVLSYVYVNVDNSVSENMQIIRENHKLRHECHGKLEIVIKGRKSNSIRGKTPKQHFPVRLVFTTAILYRNGGTQQRT